MVTYDLNGKTIYIDGRLKEKLEKHIIPELKKNDRDVVFCIAGKERDGKSTFAMAMGGFIAYKLGTEFNLSNVCMTPSELRRRIEKAKKNEVIVYDEAHRGMGSARALSELNKVLKDLFMEMGQLNLCVMIVLPSFFLLEKYIALWRTRGLFHVYISRGRRGFWVYFNEREKKKLYLYGKKTLDMNCMKWPSFRGIFHKKFPIDDDKYRDKKKKSFKERGRLTKSEQFMYQRDVLIMILRKQCKFTQKEVIHYLKEWKVNLDRSNISKIEERMRELAENE